jgi:hypothetical protein
MAEPMMGVWLCSVYARKEAFGATLVALAAFVAYQIVLTRRKIVAPCGCTTSAFRGPERIAAAIVSLAVALLGFTAAFYSGPVPVAVHVGGLVFAFIIGLAMLRGALAIRRSYQSLVDQRSRERVRLEIPWSRPSGGNRHRRHLVLRSEFGPAASRYPGARAVRARRELDTLFDGAEAHLTGTAREDADRASR